MGSCNDCLPVLGADGTVFVAHYFGVHGVAANGTVLWHTNVKGNGLHDHPSKDAFGRLYVGAEENDDGYGGSLYVFGPDGDMIGRVSFEAGVGVPTVTTDGTVLAAFHWDGQCGPWEPDFDLSV